MLAAHVECVPKRRCQRILRQSAGETVGWILHRVFEDQAIEQLESSGIVNDSAA